MQKRTFARAIGSAFALGALVAQQAHAEVPAAVSAAITEAGADAAIIGGLVLVVIVGIAAFKYMRKAM